MSEDKLIDTIDAWKAEFEEHIKIYYEKIPTPPPKSFIYIHEGERIRYVPEEQT